MTAPLPIRYASQILLIVLPTCGLTLSAAVVLLRIVARKNKQTHFGVDDWLALVALLFAIGLYVCNVITVVYGGLGVPVKEIITPDMHRLTIYLKAFLAMTEMYGAALLAIQLSVLFFYIRVFGVSARFRTACYVCMGMAVAWFVAFLVGTLASCVPTDRLWKQLTNPMYPGTCGVDQHKFCAGTGISHVLMDFLILLLPLPMVWRLQSSTSTKVGLTLVFTLGLIASVFSILRIGCLVSLLKINEADVTGSAWLSLLFEQLEVYLGLTCLCIPSCTKLLKEFISNSPLGTLLSRFRSWSSGGSHGTGEYGKEKGTGATVNDFKGLSSFKAAETVHANDSRRHLKASTSGDPLPAGANN